MKIVIIIFNIIIKFLQSINMKKNNMNINYIYKW